VFIFYDFVLAWHFYFGSSSELLPPSISSFFPPAFHVGSLHLTQQPPQQLASLMLMRGRCRWYYPWTGASILWRAWPRAHQEKAPQSSRFPGCAPLRSEPCLAAWWRGSETRV